jgi:hypothetical protein
VIALRCAWCSWTGHAAAGPVEVVAWVEREMGHPMTSLELAVSHVVCPGCAQTTLRLEAGTSTPPRRAVRAPEGLRRSAGGDP